MKNTSCAGALGRSRRPHHVCLGAVSCVRRAKVNLLARRRFGIEQGTAHTAALVEEDGLEWDLDGPWTQHTRRTEQDLIDRIVQGNEVGHYFVLLGPKVGRPGP